MAKKMTIVEQYEAIMAKCEGVLSETELAFLKERAELHAKKNASRKPTKDQLANENIKDDILALMEKGKTYTVTDVQKALGLESNQKAELVTLLNLKHFKHYWFSFFIAFNAFLRDFGTGIPAGCARSGHR